MGVDTGQDLLSAAAGARYPPAVYSGAGNACLSSLPLGVNGNASITTTAAGTIYPGNRSASTARAAAGSTAPAIDSVT